MGRLRRIVTLAPGCVGVFGVRAPRRRRACSGWVRETASVTASRYGHGDGWESKVILDPLAPPPKQAIESPGSRLVLVTEPLGVPVPRHSHYGLILAWAPIDRRTGSWACLLAWDGWRRAVDDCGRVPGARWSWVHWQRDLVTYHKPWLPDQPEGLRWFGRHHGSDMEAAWLEAAASLPQGMREAALERVNYDGPPSGA